MEPNSVEVGPMKPLRGPTPVAAQMAPIPVKSSPVDNDPIHRKKLGVGKELISVDMGMVRQYKRIS